MSGDKKREAFKLKQFVKYRNNSIVLYEFLGFAVGLAFLPLACFFGLRHFELAFVPGNGDMRAGIVSIGLCVVIALAYAIVAYIEEVRDFKHEECRDKESRTLRTNEALCGGCEVDSEKKCD